MTKLARVSSTAAVAMLLLGVGCTGDHQGERDENLAPPMMCTQAEVLAEVADATRAEAIGLHDQHVYLRFRSSEIVRIPKLGGPAEPVTGDPPVALASRSQHEISDDGYIYTLDHVLQEIVRVKKDGSTRTPLASADVESDSFAMAIHGGWLYWTSSTGTAHRVPKAGGAPATILATYGAYDDDDYRGLLAVDLDGVFFLAGHRAVFRSSDSDPLLLIRACR